MVFVIVYHRQCHGYGLCDSSQTAAAGPKTRLRGFTGRATAGIAFTPQAILGFLILTLTRFMD